MCNGVHTRMSAIVTNYCGKIAMTKKEYLINLADFAVNSDFMRQLPLEELGYSDDYDANQFVFKNDLAFVFGLIFDQGIRSSDAWKSPLLLKSRLEHLDVNRISEMKPENLTLILSQKKALHRYPAVMARNLIQTSNAIVSHFSGNASNLWRDQRSIESVRRRLLLLRGIGSKKVDLGLLMLVRDRGISFDDSKRIRMAFDVHVNRVFLRSGFYSNLNKEEKEVLHMDICDICHFPALFGTVVWFIGRHYCHETSPACDRCPLAEKCQKRA